jgi:glycosyltransferase involved in cell wall biosynthesis
MHFEHLTNRQPLVSVGIPTFNRPEGLRRTLECITRQTYKNLEIVISDNASTNSGVEEVATEYVNNDYRVKYFKQEINRGAALNFRFVLDQAAGEYFMWAADDDEWLPEFIESCLELFGSNTALVCPEMEVFWRTANRKEEIMLPVIKENMDTYSRLVALMDCLAPSMIYGLHRKEVILSAWDCKNIFDFYDCAVLLDILSKYEIIICNKRLYTAGIDASDYVVKPNKISSKSQLIYFPFLIRAASSIRSTNMNYNQKIELYLSLFLFVFNNYVHQESRYNQSSFDRKIKIHIVLILSRLCNFAHKKLRRFNRVIS